MNISEITLVNGTGYCPCCFQQKKRFRLKPRLLPETRGTNIPLFCGACKSQFIVNISAPGSAVINAEKSTYHNRE